MKLTCNEPLSTFALSVNLRRYIKGKGAADDKKALSALDASGGFKLDTPGPGYKSKFLSPKRHQVTLTVIGEVGLMDHATCHGGQGKSLVPPYARGSVCLSHACYLPRSLCSVRQGYGTGLSMCVNLSETAIIDRRRLAAFVAFLVSCDRRPQKQI